MDNTSYVNLGGRTLQQSLRHGFNSDVNVRDIHLRREMRKIADQNSVQGNVDMQDVIDDAALNTRFDTSSDAEPQQLILT